MKPREYYLEYVMRIVRAAEAIGAPENPIIVVAKLIKQTGLELKLSTLEKLYLELEEKVKEQHRLRREDLEKCGYDDDSILVLILIGAIMEISLDLDEKYPDVDTEVEI